MEDSKVYFVIPSELGEFEYRTFVSDILNRWLIEQEGNDPRTIRSHTRRPWNEQGGISALIDGELAWTKLYKFDGHIGEGWGGRGILLRDHDGTHIRPVIRAFGNSLERFLQSEGIPYEKTDYTIPKPL